MRSRVIVVCKNCGRQFTIPKSRVGRITTCSKNCSIEWRRKNYKPPRAGRSVEVRCEYCGRTFRTKLSYRLNGKYRFCSRECYLKYRREHPEEYGGENHWNWKGGISKSNRELRRREEYIKWRDAVFRRDNWTCRICGYKGHDIVAHHILDFHKYPELRFDLDNGITLCRSCHKKIHYGIGEETKFKKGQFPWNKIPIPPKEELERLYWREGFSTVAIAKKYGVCHKTVRKWLKFYQIPVRSLSEARRNYFNRVAGDVESSSEVGCVGVGNGMVNRLELP